jgi:protein involved in polysaccharide export with SLBB domain
MAGGFSDFAKVTKIYVLRHRNGAFNEVYRFNYKQVVKGHKADQNRELQPGDTVVVP